MTILISAGPGTASHSLVSRLERIFNTKRNTHKLGNGSGNIVAGFDKKSFLKYLYLSVLFKKKIIHQHFFPTEYNLNFIDKYYGLNKTNFIITYRNIFDTIKNMIKWKLKRKHTPLSFRTKEFEPYDIFNSKEFELNLLDVILIINFYALWLKINKEKLIKNIMFLNFEDIVRNDNNLSSTLSDFLKKKITLDNHISENLWEKSDIKISKNLEEFIYMYCKSFSDIDFSLIGIKKE